MNEQLLYIILIIIMLVALVLYIVFNTRKSRREAAQSKKQNEQMQRDKEKKVEQAAIKKRLQERDARQVALLHRLTIDSSKLEVAISARVSRAESAISLAEREFEDKLLDPFWDAIEIATTELAMVETLVKKFDANVKSYLHESKHVVMFRIKELPRISPDMNQLSRITEIYDRLRKSVREAQRSADYSTIFHLRRTNKILVEGFTTLGQALNDLGDRLERSIDAVAISVLDLGEKYDRAADGVLEEIRNIKAINEEALTYEKYAHTKQNDILENIHRGLRPIEPN